MLLESTSSRWSAHNASSKGGVDGTTERGCSAAGTALFSRRRLRGIRQDLLSCSNFCRSFVDGKVAASTRVLSADVRTRKFSATFCNDMSTFESRRSMTLLLLMPLLLLLLVVVML
jgi:hypothetical protein